VTGRPTPCQVSPNSPVNRRPPGGKRSEFPTSLKPLTPNPGPEGARPDPRPLTPGPVRAPNP
jgi:hypothetical protein